MQLNVDDFLKDIVNCTSSIITILVARFTPGSSKLPPIEKQDIVEPIVKTVVKHKRKVPPFRFRLVELFQRRGVFIASIFIVSIILIFLINLLGDITIPINPKSTSPTTTPNPVQPPLTKMNVKDVWLDEMKPILPRNKSVFLHEWNKFDPILIKGVFYPHSIGLCIPEDELDDYFDEASPNVQEHSEDIEYLLSYNYQTLQFDYGIDDLSFPENIETACKCEFKIVVQSCNSSDYLGSSSDILYDSDWINYRSSIRRSPSIVVSDCESIRVTVTWKFNVRAEGPIAFNIAIINPILRGKKTGSNVSEPSSTHTKPDSIR